MLEEIATFLRENERPQYAKLITHPRDKILEISSFLRSKGKYGYAVRLEDLFTDY